MRVVQTQLAVHDALVDDGGVGDPGGSVRQVEDEVRREGRWLGVAQVGGAALASLAPARLHAKDFCRPPLPPDTRAGRHGVEKDIGHQRVGVEARDGVVEGPQVVCYQLHVEEIGKDSVIDTLQRAQEAWRRGEHKIKPALYANPYDIKS